MKNLKFVLFFAVLLILLLPFQVQAQEVTQASTGILQKIGDWIKGNAIEMVIVFVSGIAAKHGWTQALKAIAAKGSVITKEVSEFFADGSNFLSVVDKSINDDGTIKQNSIQEVIAAGKEVIAEGKDVVISIKPKT